MTVMTVIVQGHGNRTDDQTTFVPVGTTLRFYSGFDVDLSQNVALIAIANGAQAPAQDPIIGGGKKTDVANYQFETMEDQFIARWLTISGETSIPIYFVGNSEIKNKDRLCNRPEACDGTHTCDGVLGVLKEEKDIVILACRGYTGNKNRTIEQSYGTDAKNPLQRLDLDVTDFVGKILALAKSDPAAVERQVDELPQEHIAMLINRKDFQAWQKARYLKDFAQAGDVKQMIGHLKANEKDLDTTSGDRSITIMKWLEDIPSYGAAVDQSVTTNLRAVLRELNGISDSERNVDSALKSRASIATAITAMRDADFEASKNWKPDDSLLAETTKRNAANVKAMSAEDRETIVAGRGPCCSVEAMTIASIAIFPGEATTAMFRSKELHSKPWRSKASTTPNFTNLQAPRGVFQDEVSVHTRNSHNSSTERRGTTASTLTATTDRASTSTTTTETASTWTTKEASRATLRIFKDLRTTLQVLGSSASHVGGGSRTIGLDDLG